MELLARGRDADVYALDDDRVLRRCRDTAPSELETRLMTHVRAAGYPVPEILDVSGTDIVMRRLHGPTLMEALIRGEPNGGAILADVHNRLHTLAAPDWLPRHRTGGDRIVHLDLHPANIILTDDGPAVIDWTNAVAADPALDVADTVVVLRTVSPEGVDPELMKAAGGQLVDEFLAHVDDDPSPRLRAAIEQRMTNVNFTPAEIQRLRDWLERVA